MMGEGVLIGVVHGYAVLLEYASEEIIVFERGGTGVRMARSVPGITCFIENARELRIAWVSFRDDGDEVIYLYDKGDCNFGYAVNLADPHCSEWGYAPVR